jgi:hypothetical protein
MLEGVNTQKLNYEMNQNGQIIITAPAPLSGKTSKTSNLSFPNCHNFYS